MEMLKIKRSDVVELINLYSMKHYEYNVYLELEKDNTLFDEWMSSVNEYMNIILSLKNKGVDMRIIHRIIEKANTNKAYDGYLYDMLVSCNIKIIDLNY